MKTLAHYAGQRVRQKYDTNAFAARYWGTMGREKPFTRPNGTIGVDKTRGFHSRPGKKQALRNANRSQVKSARQALKKLLAMES